MGMMFARTFRCVIVTPLGSAVAPEVKMISAREELVAPVFIGFRGSGVPGFRGSRVTDRPEISLSFHTGG